MAQMGYIEPVQHAPIKILYKYGHSSLSVFESAVTTGWLGSPMCRQSLDRRSVLLLTPSGFQGSMNTIFTILLFALQIAFLHI